MALSKDRLGQALADAVITFSGLTVVAADRAQIESLMKVIADEIIIEFLGNAVLKSDGATAAHASGAPATITALPGVIVS